MVGVKRRPRQLSRVLSPFGRIVIFAAFVMLATVAACTLVMVPSRFGF